MAELEADPAFQEAQKALPWRWFSSNYPAGPVGLNISMDELLLAAVDRVVAAAGLSRSVFLAEATRLQSSIPGDQGIRSPIDLGGIAEATE